MKKDTISNSINKISDVYIEEAFEELYSNSLDNTPKEEINMKRMIFRRVAVACTVCAILGAGTFAYAKGLFKVKHREAKTNEVFSFECLVEGESEMQTVEWKDAKYVMTFDGPDECKEVEFKEKWVPITPNEEWNKNNTNANGWRNALTSEFSKEDNGDGTVAYDIRLYYASQFRNNGAMILLYDSPEKIIEDHIDEFDIIKFNAKRDELYGGGTVNYYFMLNKSAGYVVVISGSSDMKTLAHIADELEIRETGKVIHSSDFDKNVTFLDPGRG